MTTRTAMLSGALLLLSSVPAFAVNTAKVYKSGPLVLIFIGFFALLIVLQLLPAISTLYGLLKGVFADRTKNARASETVSPEN